MGFRRWVWLGSAAVAWLFLVAPRASGGAGAAVQAPETHACVGTLDGAKFPTLVPSAFLWQQLFESAGNRNIEALRGKLDARSFERLVEAADVALARSSALLRAGLAAGSPDALQADRDIAAAEALLDARDELTRTLTPPDFDELEQFVQTMSREVAYVFDVPGKWVPWDAGQRCKVTVKGSERPDLIPEAYAWEFYFRVRSVTAAPAATGPDRHSVEHLLALRRHSLSGIPLEHIQIVINVATAATKRVDAIRAAEPNVPHDHQKVLLDIQRTVFRARRELVRALLRTSWLAVLGDMGDMMRGTTFDFPTGA